MKNPLILNIRCVCIEEYMKLQEIHEIYRKQRSEGEILSLYVGADKKFYGRNKIVDRLLDKVFGDDARPVPTERITKEKLVAAQGNGDGTVTETVERTFVPEEGPEVRIEPRGELHWEEEPVPESMINAAEAPEAEDDGADWSF